MNTHYKGKIAEIKLHGKFFDNINDVFGSKDEVLLDIDFTKDLEGENKNVTFTQETIEVIENVIPFRKEGRFECLPHIDEGFIGGNWAKGETTAKNEKRFVTEMQQRKIDYKNDGMNTLKYNLVSTEMYTDNCLFINVTV